MAQTSPDFDWPRIGLQVNPDDKLRWDKTIPRQTRSEVIRIVMGLTCDLIDKYGHNALGALLHGHLEFVPKQSVEPIPTTRQNLAHPDKDDE